MIERSVKSLLSLIVAGLGQIGKGVIFIQLVNGALTVVLMGWVLLSIVGMLDAYMTAERNDERYSFR